MSCAEHRVWGVTWRQCLLRSMQRCDEEIPIAITMVAVGSRAEVDDIGSPETYAALSKIAVEVTDFWQKS